MWAIKHVEEDLYWTNALGWVEEEFDIFTLEEREHLTTPVDGKWFMLLKETLH